MKVRINADIHMRDDQRSTNKVTEAGAIVGHLVTKVIPAMEPIDLPDDEARKLLDAFAGSWEVGKEPPDELEARLEQLAKERAGLSIMPMPTQTPSRA